MLVWALGQDVLDGPGSGTKLTAVETSKDVSFLSLKTMITIMRRNDHDHDHDHGGTDPHVWLEPSEYKIQMKNICDALSEKDSEHKSEYAVILIQSKCRLLIRLIMGSNMGSGFTT